MASPKDMRNFLRKYRVDVSGLLEKPELVAAYKSAFTSNAGAVHSFEAKLGDLECLVHVNSASPDIVVCGLHGVGASMEDLASLSDLFFSGDNDVKCAFIFPNATVALVKGASYCWWMIDVRELGRRFAEMRFGEILNDEPAGLASARDSALAMMNDASKVFNVPLNRFALFGFSQGSMLCLDLLFHLKEPPTHLGLFSCGPMMESKWKQKFEALPLEKRDALLRTEIMQSHGSSDVVIPAMAGEFVNAFLRGLGFTVAYKKFSGGHTVKDSVASELFKSIACKARKWKKR